MDIITVTFIALMVFTVMWLGLLKGGLLGLTAFHVTANTGVLTYYGWSVHNFFVAQLMGLPFYLKHVLVLSIIVLVCDIARTTFDWKLRV